MNKDFAPSWDEPQHMTAGHANHVNVGLKTFVAAPLKQIVTIRLDVDTLDWFKSAGPGYQTRMNQILREHMDAQKAIAANAD